MVKTIIACLFPIFYLFLTIYSTRVVQGSVLLTWTLLGLVHFGIKTFNNKRKLRGKVIIELIVYFVVILYALYLLIYA